MLILQCETLKDLQHTQWLYLSGAAFDFSKKKYKNKNCVERSCSVDVPVKRVWGDNTCPNDSCVPLHPQLKLRRGPNVEWQRQAQRSAQWGIEADRTARLNGAGDFPSPPLPSRHSQSLLGKVAPQPANQAARECSGWRGSRSLSGTMHYSHAPLRH